jgi:hypothetical protein
MSDLDCPADDVCKDWACTSGQCVAASTNEGQPLPMTGQNLGDCKTNVCQEGNVVVLAEASDVFDDGNACSDDLCNESMPVNVASAAGTSCPTLKNPTGIGKCSGAGVCLGCFNDTDCGVSYACSQNDCFSCADGIKNGFEADVDCGGDCDSKCNTGQTCNTASDCFNGVCAGGVCAAPSCTDSVKNGNEADVDCGGICALNCGPGKQCNSNGDCQSNQCVNNMCL